MLEGKGPLDAELSVQRPVHRSLQHKLLCFALLSIALLGFQSYNVLSTQSPVRLSAQATASLARCRSLSAPAGPSPDFHKRTQSDRFVPGTKAILIKNAKIWTGDKNGTEVIEADILLDKGLVKGIGRVRAKILAAYQDIDVVDVKGAWVTPGYVKTTLTGSSRLSIYCQHCRPTFAPRGRV